MKMFENDDQVIDSVITAKNISWGSISPIPRRVIRLVLQSGEARNFTTCIACTEGSHYKLLEFDHNFPYDKVPPFSMSGSYLLESMAGDFSGKVDRICMHLLAPMAMVSFERVRRNGDEVEVYIEIKKWVSTVRVSLAQLSEFFGEELLFAE